MNLKSLTKVATNIIVTKIEHPTLKTTYINTKGDSITGVVKRY